MFKKLKHQNDYVIYTNDIIWFLFYNVKDIDVMIEITIFIIKIYSFIQKSFLITNASHSVRNEGNTIQTKYILSRPKSYFSSRT